MKIYLCKVCQVFTSWTKILEGGGSNPLTPLDMVLSVTLRKFYQQQGAPSRVLLKWLLQEQSQFTLLHKNWSWFSCFYFSKEHKKLTRVKTSFGVEKRKITNAIERLAISLSFRTLGNFLSILICSILMFSGTLNAMEVRKL